ncbi:MAG: DMT family transporter [Cloacibacillus sp.]
MTYIKGVVFVILATLCWGSGSPIAKLMVAADIHVISVLIIRNVLVASILGVWLYCIKKEDLVSVFRNDMKFYGSVSFFSIMCNTGGYAMSLIYLSTSEAIILHYTFPLFTMVISLWAAHEKPVLLDFIAGTLVIVGVYIGVACESYGNRSGISIAGVLWGLLSVSGISLLVITTREKAKKGDVDQCKILFYGNLFGGFGLFICKSFFLGWDDIGNLTFFYLTVTMLQAVMSTLLAYALFYASFNCIPATLVSILSAFEIVVVFLLSAAIVGTFPTLHEIIGGLLIIIAIIGSTIKGTSKPI